MLPLAPLGFAALALFILTREDRPSAPAGAPASAADRDYITSQVALLGWPKQEVDRVIMRESGWKPSAVNLSYTFKDGGHAVGLIQFTPQTLRGMGYHDGWQAFARLSAREQLPYILRFFRPYRWTQPGDTYLATAWPAALGKEDGYQVAAPGSAAWRANPSLREGREGPITAGSIRRRVT